MAVDGTVTLAGWLETERSVVRWRLGPIVAERPVTAPFTLTLAHVVDVTWDDGAQIGGIAVDGVAFDAEAGVVRISGHTAGDLDLAVTALAGELVVRPGPPGPSRTTVLRWRWGRRPRPDG